MLDTLCHKTERRRPRRTIFVAIAGFLSTRVHTRVYSEQQLVVGAAFFENAETSTTTNESNGENMRMAHRVGFTYIWYKIHA